MALYTVKDFVVVDESLIWLGNDIAVEILSG